MEFIASNFAPIMFAGLIVFLLLGFPVAFSLGACGLFFGFVGIELGVFPSSVLAWLPQRLIAWRVRLAQPPSARVRRNAEAGAELPAVALRQLAQRHSDTVGVSRAVDCLPDGRRFRDQPQLTRDVLRPGLEKAIERAARRDETVARAIH